MHSCHEVGYDDAKVRDGQTDDNAIAEGDAMQWNDTEGAAGRFYVQVQVFDIAVSSLYYDSDMELWKC